MFMRIRQLTLDLHLKIGEGNYFPSKTYVNTEYDELKNASTATGARLMSQPFRCNRLKYLEQNT